MYHQEQLHIHALIAQFIRYYTPWSHSTSSIFQKSFDTNGLLNNKTNSMLELVHLPHHLINVSKLYGGYHMLSLKNHYAMLFATLTLIFSLLYAHHNFLSAQNLPQLQVNLIQITLVFPICKKSLLLLLRLLFYLLRSL